jgi:hypothetical protein
MFSHVCIRLAFAAVGSSIKVYHLITGLVIQKCSMKETQDTICSLFLHPLNAFQVSLLFLFTKKNSFFLFIFYSFW